MAFPITSKVLIAGLIILILVMLLVFGILYAIAKYSGVPSSLTSVSSGYNASGHNLTGYNTSGYNSSGYNSSVAIVKKGGPVT